ncbi:MAG: Gfo/Idh/MocA family oxidoreductase [Haloarculaceae archaeon]
MSIDIGFVGAGGIAQWKHFDTLEASDRASVVGVCDVDEETAREAGERFDASWFTDHHALYETVDLDAVFVCLPPFAHGDQETAAAERGVDLFVEKPLALSNRKAREVREAVEESGVVAQVGYNWRYSPGLDRAHELLDGRDVGYVEGYWWGGVPGGEGHWWRHADRSGGQTVEQATHIFDAVRSLAGEVERVTAAGSHRLVDAVDFPDATSATMTHENGAVSHVSTTCATDDGKTGLEVVADGATLTVAQDAVAGTVDGESVDETFESDPYRGEVEAFLDAVETGDDASVRSTYADATRSLALTLAVNESVESGTPVRPGGD